MRIRKGFFKRVKIAIGFIVKRKNARIMTCGNCKGTDLIPISNAFEDTLTTEKIKADLLFIQFSKCRKCGAVCKEMQLWNHSGNVKELEEKLT